MKKYFFFLCLCATAFASCTKAPTHYSGHVDMAVKDGHDTEVTIGVTFADSTLIAVADELVYYANSALKFECTHRPTYVPKSMFIYKDDDAECPALLPLTGDTVIAVYKASVSGYAQNAYGTEGDVSGIYTFYATVSNEVLGETNWTYQLHKAQEAAGLDILDDDPADYKAYFERTEAREQLEKELTTLIPIK